MTDVAKPVELPLAIRGNPENLGPGSAAPLPQHPHRPASPSRFTKGSGRLELADDILKQPIAMRVIVNRIWKGHFGTGIVDTPSNFGITGERPTNPDLLEYLATFVRQKRHVDQEAAPRDHAELGLSACAPSTIRPAAAKDSGNRSLLALRPQTPGSRSSFATPSCWSPATWINSLGGPSADLTPAFTRRTVYGKVSRYKLDEYLQLFDFPAPNISAEKRFTTTVPLQRLFLMNSDFMQAEAEALAKRVAAEPDNRARIRKAYHAGLRPRPQRSRKSSSASTTCTPSP